MANSLLQTQVYTILNAINAQAKTGGELQAEIGRASCRERVSSPV